jgi:sporulation protein YlmC with PRC-barrel domain
MKCSINTMLVALIPLVLTPAIALAQEVRPGAEGEHHGQATGREHAPGAEVAAQRARMTGDQAVIARQERDDFLADKLIGSSVKNVQDEDIGQISDLLLDRDGNVTGLIVGVGGFLGIGERDVALRWDAVELTTDDDGDPVVRIDLDRDTLENAQEFEYRDDDDQAGVWGERRDRERAAERMRVGGEAAIIARQEQDQFSVDRLLGSTLTNPEGEEIGEISELLLDRDGRIAGVVIGVGGFLGIGERDVALQWDAIELMTDEDGDPVARVDIDRDTLEQASEFEYRDDDDVAGVWGSPREREERREPARAAERDAPAAAHDQFVARQEAGDIRAEMLMGKSLKNVQGEELGEISDLLVDREGKVRGVVVGVGGFLGIGRRDVALSWDAVEWATDEDGETIARVDVDRSTLRNAPRFEARKD